MMDGCARSAEADAINKVSSDSIIFSPQTSCQTILTGWSSIVFDSQLSLRVVTALTRIG